MKGGDRAENVLYADVLALVNFSMDFIALYLCGRLFSHSLSLPRVLLAALLGGVYGVVSVVLSLDGWLGVLLTVFASACMTRIAFGARSLVRTTAALWAIGVLLGGCMTALSGMLGGVLPRASGAEGWIGAVIVTVSLARAFRTRLIRGYASVTLTHGTHSVRARALIDSGNLVRDPISGDPVILVSRPLAFTLLGEGSMRAYAGDFRDGYAPDIRAVPIRERTGTRIVYGYYSADVRVEHGGSVRECSATVCVDPLVSDFGGAQALLPGDLLT